MENKNHLHAKDKGSFPRLIAWEVTRNCNLECIHCRASAKFGKFVGEFTTQAGLNLLDQIAEVGKSIVILTGGEPLLRNDIFKIAEYGTQLGLRMVMAPNGTLITQDIAKKIKDSGIQRISVSLDGASQKSHDKFRGVDGCFDKAIEGINHAKNADVEFQINTTITNLNLNEISDIQKLAENLGAVAHHIFLLVPTGRGKYIINNEIAANEYEDTLNWFYEQQKKTSMQLKATCAPHYYRILRQKAHKECININFKSHGMDAVTRGCLGGVSFCFISHVGDVQPCGFLDLNCGNVLKSSFSDIWNKSDVFLSLRDYSQLKGKCGICQYKKFCGGCRARAYEKTGDFLGEEPLCSYKP